MGRFALALLATLWLAAPAWGVIDDTCTATDTFTLSTGITDGGGASEWDCLGGSTSPGANDDFIVASGGNVTIDGSDWEQDGVEASGLKCESGGTLTISNGTDVVINSKGLLIEAGCTFTATGVFRDRVSGGGTTTDPVRFPLGKYEPCNFSEACASAQDEACFSYVDDVYGETVPAGPAMENFMSASIGTFEPWTSDYEDTNDMLVMWDFDDTLNDGGVDSLFTYPVTSTDVLTPAGAGDYGFCVGTLQGRGYGRCDDGASAGDSDIQDDETTVCRDIGVSGGTCTNACIAALTTTSPPSLVDRLREIDVTTITADLSVGSGCGFIIDEANGINAAGRSQLCGGEFIQVAEATSGILQDGERIGDFIRFAAGANDTRERAYKIIQTIDCSADEASPHPCNGAAGYDIVVIADRKGVRQAQTSGDQAWIDRGWQEGDSFFVMDPVYIRGGMASTATSCAGIAGTIDLYGVVFEKLGCNSSAIAPYANNGIIGLNDATIARWKHVILRDDVGLYVENAGVGIAFQQGSYDIGHTDFHPLTTHGMNTGTVGATTVKVTNMAHTGTNDGTWVPAGSGTDTIRMDKSHIRNVDPNGTSVNFWSGDGGGNTGIFTNVVATDVARSASSTSDACIAAMKPIGTTSISMTDFTFYGGPGIVEGPVSLDNTLIVGNSGCDIGGSPISVVGTSRALAIGWINFSQSGTSLANIKVGVVSNDGTTLDGLFTWDTAIPVRNTTSMFLVRAYAKLSNFAIVNPFNSQTSDHCTTTSQNCPILSAANGATDGMTIENGVITWGGGRDSGYNRVLRFRDITADPGNVHRGILVSNYDYNGTDGEILSLGISSHSGAGGILDLGGFVSICTHANESDNGSTATAIFPIRGQNPRFRDIGSYDLEVLAPGYAGVCGFQKTPGLRRDAWSIRKLGLDWKDFTASPSSVSGGGGGGGTAPRTY